jgi:hypothetical protein
VPSLSIALTIRAGLDRPRVTLSGHGIWAPFCGVARRLASLEALELPGSPSSPRRLSLADGPTTHAPPSNTALAIADHPRSPSPVPLAIANDDPALLEQDEEWGSSGPGPDDTWIACKEFYDRCFGIPSGIPLDGIRSFLIRIQLRDDQRRFNNIHVTRACDHRPFPDHATCGHSAIADAMLVAIGPPSAGAPARSTPPLAPVCAPLGEQAAPSTLGTGAASSSDPAGSAWATHAGGGSAPAETLAPHHSRTIRASLGNLDDVLYHFAHEPERTAHSLAAIILADSRGTHGPSDLAQLKRATRTLWIVAAGRGRPLPKGRGKGGAHRLPVVLGHRGGPRRRALRGPPPSSPPPPPCAAPGGTPAPPPGLHLDFISPEADDPPDWGAAELPTPDHDDDVDLD